MPVAEALADFFKSEVKTSGAKLFSQEKVSKPNVSDTGIHAYIRSSPPVKVYLSSVDIASEMFRAECNCPVAKKGRLCKHIWATVLTADEVHPDFLSGKIGVEIGSTNSNSNASATQAEPTRKIEAKARQESYAAAAKVRASEYRKEQYQKFKERSKSNSKKKRDPEPIQNEPSLPADVQGACAYFTQNGFSMMTGPTEETASKAKRKLSRVFHPDKGGSHDEMVELNRNWEILMDFLREK